jgi:hypothetical protein
VNQSVTSFITSNDRPAPISHSFSTHSCHITSSNPLVYLSIRSPAAPLYLFASCPLLALCAESSSGAKVGFQRLLQRLSAFIRRHRLMILCLPQRPPTAGRLPMHATTHQPGDSSLPNCLQPCQPLDMHYIFVKLHPISSETMCMLILDEKGASKRHDHLQCCHGRHRQHLCTAGQQQQKHHSRTPAVQPMTEQQ